MTVVKTTLFALMLAAGAAVAGEATPPAAATKAAAKPAATEAAAKETADAKPARPKACEYISGSRMRPSLAEGCRTASGPLRVFTQEDLQRTGEIDMNQALRKLDPIFH